ncbi:phosphonate ABC transporter permease [Defluviimonas sp. 20V17]|uniref:Phosphonate ABC transporter, permease protein PhnE n=1 Tax=Allgaiera indica TaxID=765699 RepID=A0AAN4UUF1_9RHOB|nr:phosphonate ABC transporter, permease protein PhnE [Allgaiera indica]KDB05035.1 phosphonate ABC transporter permease [Defluviimonas sp. 20V17]GHE05490.1 phosphonate ABC transporter, permease protein PhnE [Allgaiera indica]SDX70457.1 phosphonate transport system permease protein [Allgaiera indica]
MSAAAGGAAVLRAGEAALLHGFAQRKWRALAVPAVLLAYFAYIFFAFDLGAVIGHAKPSRAETLLRDVWSYKTEVTRRNRAGTLEVAIEGERNGTYPQTAPPDWVRHDGETTKIALPDGAQVTYLPGAKAELRIPGFGSVHVGMQGRRVVLQLPEGKTRPGWISASRTRVAIDRGSWRFSMTRNETRTFRYFAGWELFFFTLDSPFHGKSWTQLAALAMSDRQVVPGMSNLRAMAYDIWTNKVWHHGMVAGAMLETVLMAFLGTMGAGLIALPLAFLAARNFMQLNVLRLALRRVFDFLRGVDGLIWTVILSRAFGPGPLTGSLAILLTDTGTFGKMFSEALENIEGKQVEGVASTGANALQRARFGVIPQLAPVILSQLLYYLESNTRSATVIGAIVGGGIGLLLTQAIVTGKDWEEVTYYVILVVITVMLMDGLSGWIRRKFIKG